MSRLGALCGILVLSLLFLVSCASTFEITSDHLSIACDSCRQQGVPVDVLWEPPDRPFVAIAHVEASTNIPERATWEDVKLVLCREAHDLGADAVVIGAWVHEDESWNLGPLGYGGEAKLLRGLAIRYEATKPGT